MPGQPRYEQPFYWWGPGWQPRPERTLRDLLADGVLTAEQAAFLWAALARRWSLVVAGGPSGIGKSTLLAALLPLMPPTTRHIYLRGSYESFAFLDDASMDPDQAALLINEISPHLPIYLWGPGVQRALELRKAGHTLLATAHARTPIEFFQLLTGSPLRVPPSHAAAFDLCVLLTADAERQTGGRLSEIWHMQPAPSLGVTLDLVDATSEPNLLPDEELRVRQGLLLQFLESAEGVAARSSSSEPSHIGGLDHP